MAALLPNRTNNPSFTSFPWNKAGTLIEIHVPTVSMRGCAEVPARTTSWLHDFRRVIIYSLQNKLVLSQPANQCEFPFTMQIVW